MVVLLELLLSEQCPLLQVCVCAHCSRCVHTWMGQMQRTNFTAGYSLLCIIMYVTTKKKKKKKKIQNRYFFFSKPIMVKCLNIGKNIGKPIYRSISKAKQGWAGQYLDGRPPGKTRLLLEEVLVRPAGGALNRGPVSLWLLKMQM